MTSSKWKLLALIAAAMMVFSACSGSSDDTATTAGGGPDTTTTTQTDGGTATTTEGESGNTDDLAGSTISFWIMGDTATAFEALIADFTAETGVTVEVDAIPWDAVNDRLTTAVASGGGPDVSQIGLSHLPSFIAGETLLDVSEYVDDYPNLARDNFPDGVMDALNGPDATYSFPWVSDTRVLFYRSDILAEAGFDSPPTTWDELMEMAAVLAERGATDYGYYIPQWDAPLPIAYTWQAGGDVIGADGSVDLETPEFLAAVDHYLEFYDKGLVPISGDWDQALGFITGAAPMLVSGPYLAGAINDQAPELEGSWNVTTVPTGLNDTSLFAGSNVGVWSNTDQPAAALALLDYLAQPSTQLAWYAAVNELPAASAALAELQAGDDANVAVYADQLSRSRLLPTLAGWDALGWEILTTLNSIALAGADKDEALADLFARVDEILEG